MADKKPGFIPMVDIVKSGVKKVDPYKEIRDDDGCVKITRTKRGEESRNKSLAREITEHEEKMRKLKDIAESYGMSKKDIKEMKEDIDEDDEEKERKKAKKASKLMDPYFAALISSGVMPSDVGQYIEEGGEKGKKKKKKKKKKKDKERANLEGFTVKEKKKDKDKKHKNKDKEDEDAKQRSEVAERFKVVEKIMNKNLNDVDETMNLIDDRLKEITENAERMKSKDYIISNYISAKSSLLSTKQKIATDIGANRAKIYEIEMKKEKTQKEGASSDADMIAKLFPGIALGGKTGDLAKYISESGKNKDGKKKKKKHYDDDDIVEDSDLDAIERKLLKNGDIEYSKYDENIEWEGKFKVAVKKSYKDAKWKFIAIDDDGQILNDVPKSMLPSKDAASLKFDDENDVAIDINTNRAYPVFQVPNI